MADGGDCLQTGPGGKRPTADRERFLTFALTAADMLLEVSPEGRIEFAAGAFQSRLGEPPEAWLGRPVEGMVVLPDRAAAGGARRRGALLPYRVIPAQGAYPAPRRHRRWRRGTRRGAAVRGGIGRGAVLHRSGGAG